MPDKITFPAASSLNTRFRGYLPVVVDVETGGFDCTRHALLEIAAVVLDMDADGQLLLGESVHTHVQPAPGTLVDPQSLEITKIDIDHPFRTPGAEPHLRPHPRSGEKTRLPTRDSGRPQRSF